MIEAGLFKNLLFIDIETVSVTPEYNDLEERMQKAWEWKASFFQDQERTVEESFFDRAGIYAEFGKVIAISMGVMYWDRGAFKARIKTLIGKDEKKLLEEFLEVLNKYDSKNLILCAHNGKEFDFPYLSRRLLINRLPLPGVLQLMGKKPWEVNHLDTMEMWKFGDRKNYTSLELLCAALGIETSKSELDGSMINDAYYNRDMLEEIGEYCGKDVFNVMQVYLTINNLQILDKKNVKFIQ